VAVGAALRLLVETEREKRRAALARLRKMVEDGEVVFPESDEVER